MANQNYIWFDGKFVKFEDAKVHVLTHSLQYGSGIFEGIRCYGTDKGSAIFRLHDHAKRFFNTAKINGMPLKYNIKQFEEACVSLINKNKIDSAYIRPFAYYKDVGIGFNVKGKTTSMIISAYDFGNIYGDDQRVLRCKVSSWLRINSTTLPASSKTSGNYINSIIAAKEANDSGYDEAIMMSNQGTVAEAPTDNIFMVDNNVLITPPKSANILLGITRDSIIKIAENIGIEVVEREIRRDELYTCDELFFSGTASNVVPVVSVDSRTVGKGKAGPITLMLKERYNRIARGQDNEFIHWLTFTKG